MPRRVLIVEDESIIAFALQRLIEAHGYRVTGIARTGTAAVEAACADRPDVVLMDIQMPEMDGLTATRKLMETCPHPVVVVTGYAEYRKEAEGAGAMGFALKPLQPQHVPALIDTALQRFQWFRVVHNEYPACQEALAAWLLVQRAVRTLAEREGIPEVDAFVRLQEMAAAQGATLATAAQEVLTERCCA